MYLLMFHVEQFFIVIGLGSVNEYLDITYVQVVSRLGLGPTS